MDFLQFFVTNENLDILIKLGVALLLGTLIGLERVFAKRSAGPRTYALVTVGSALFVAIAQLSALDNLFIGIDSDPFRLTGNIIVGIGFLGAGIIIFKDSTLVGLTTAAGIWVSAAIGMAVGYGYYSAAILGTLFTLFIFTALWYIELWLLKLHDNGDEKTS